MELKDGLRAWEFKNVTVAFLCVAVLTFVPRAADATTSCTSVDVGGEATLHPLHNPAERRCFVFSGDVGDVIRIGIVEVSGIMEPSVELVRDDGEVKCGSVRHAELTCTIDKAGSHSVWIRASQGAGAGVFALRVQRLNEPFGCAALADGVPLSMRIGVPGDALCFTVASSMVNDVLRVRIVPGNTPVDPVVELIEPNGTVLCGSVHSNDFACETNVTGPHVIYVRDRAAKTGKFTVVANIAPPLHSRLEGRWFELHAVSLGCCNHPDVNFGTLAAFHRDGVTLYARRGGAGGGRGFNAVALDATSGIVIDGPRNFETWGTQRVGTAMNAFVDFLERQPNGAIVMIAIGDEGGLNVAQSCSPNGYPWTQRAYAALEALGARLIRNYCWRHSYSLIAVKGEGAKDEQLAGQGVQVTSRFVRSERPVISVALNSSQFTTGETLSMAATIAPRPSTPPLVDAYVVIQLPTGQLVSLQLDGRTRPGVVPMARRFTPSSWQRTLLNYTVNGTEPAGIYTVYAVLTEPGTLNFASELDQFTFRVQFGSPLPEVRHREIVRLK
jgi:hypothetical protein